MQKLKLSRGAEFIINRLTENGFKAYAVGGCVRDLLRGKTPDDYDVTSSARPEQTLAVFKDLPVFTTGLKHGTVTVVYEKENFEVTTFRRDGDYSDGRRPDEVSFSCDIKEDLSRRDFTVNAAAYNYADGLIDPFGAQSDIKNGILRCVGDPTKRFAEDSLRILRLVRFCSTLGFAAAAETAAAAEKLRGGLKRVSGERIFTELTKTINGANATCALMQFKDIIFEVLPELAPCDNFDQKSPWHAYTVYEHIARSVGAADGDEAIKWCMLLHDCGKPECFTQKDGVGHFYGHAAVSAKKAQAVFARLKFSSALKKRALFLIENHDYRINPDEKSVKKVLSKWGYSAFYDILKVRYADNFAQGTPFSERERSVTDELKLIADRVKARGDCVTLKDLAINGSDVIAMGAKPEKVGKILNNALSQVISGSIENDKQKLSEYIKRLI